VILGFLGLLVANTALALGAAALARRFATGVGSLDALLFLLIRLLLLSTVVLAAGLTGTLRASVLGPVGALALAGLLIGCRPLGLRFPRIPSASPILAAFVGLVALRFGLQVFFFAPHLGDAVCYHLPKIAEWIRAGGFTHEMGLHPHVTFPAGFELVETWWVVFLRHDVLIEAAGAEFLVLAGASTIALARYLDLSPTSSLLAAAITIVSPGLHLSATSCLNDAAVAALVVATIAIAARRGPAWALIVVFGLGVGIKATYLYAMPGVAVLAWANRRGPAVPSVRRWAPFLLSAAALAVGGFWFARNLWWYGNPVFPVGSPGYEHDPVAVQAGPRLSSLVATFSDLVNWRIYDRQCALGANVDDMAGWGAGSFALGLVALLIGVRADPRLRVLGLAFLTSLASCFLLSVHDPWCLKYVFFAPAVLALAAARLAQAQPAVARMAGVCLALDFILTMLPYDLPLEDFRGLARQPWRERAMLALREPPLPAGAVGCFGGYTARAYSLYGPDFGREVVYLRPASLGELIEGMRRRQVDVLYASPVGSEQAALLDEGLRSGALRKIGKQLYRRAGD
jgi:hypothetical protein